MQRSFCLSPTRLPRARLQPLRALQPLLNRLHDAVGRDVPFVLEALHSRAPCAWRELELDTYERVTARASQKPRLLLPNSVYLHGADGRPVLTCSNVQAGEPYQLRLVATHQAADYPEVESGPLDTACDAIARAARLVHAAAPCVAVLSKPRAHLALRTSADLRGVAEALRSRGVRTVHVSMPELGEATVDDGSATRTRGRYTYFSLLPL